MSGKGKGLETNSPFSLNQEAHCKKNIILLKYPLWLTDATFAEKEKLLVNRALINMAENGPCERLRRPRFGGQTFNGIPLMG